MFRNMESFMISPLGIEILTLGLMSGSDGKTFSELSRLFLGCEIKTEELNEIIRFYKSFITKLQNIENVDIYFANYLFIAQKYEITKKFQDYVNYCLGIKTRAVDFSGDIFEIFRQIDKEIK